MGQDATMIKLECKNPSAAAIGSIAVFIALAVLAAYPATAGKRAGCDISIVTEPPQATVTFDGKKEQALTPVTIHTSPGTHTLVINKSNYVESRRRFTVRPVQARMLVDVKLEPILGLVLIHSEPSGADVTIDDAQRGQTPLLITDLRLGTYRVRATLPGAIPVEKNLEVADRVPQMLDIVMRSDSGNIRCASDPTNAEVTVNGAARGQTPCTISNVPPGKAIVVLTLEGYQPHEETLDVHAGDELTVDTTLKPLPASLEIFSIPQGAIIYVDNERRGKAPLTLDNLAPGEHRVRAELPGHEPLPRTVELKQGKRTSEEFRLERIAGALEVTTTPAGVKVLVDNVDRGVTKGDASKPDVPSEPLIVENLEPGSHSVVMTRKGYEKATAAVEIVKSQKAALSQDMKRLFIPDILLHTGNGPHDMYTGVLIERCPNGDLRVEVKPGIFRRFSKSEIRSEKDLLGTDPSKKE